MKATVTLLDADGNRVEQFTGDVAECRERIGQFVENMAFDDDADGNGPTGCRIIVEPA